MAQAANPLPPLYFKPIGGGDELHYTERSGPLGNYRVFTVELAKEVQEGETVMDGVRRREVGELHYDGTKRYTFTIAAHITETVALESVEGFARQVAAYSSDEVDHILARRSIFHVAAHHKENKDHVTTEAAISFYRRGRNPFAMQPEAMQYAFYGTEGPNANGRNYAGQRTKGKKRTIELNEGACRAIKLMRVTRRPPQLALSRQPNPPAARQPVVATGVGDPARALLADGPSVLTALDDGAGAGDGGAPANA